MIDWGAALRLTGIGFFIVVCILLGAGGGLWLDGRFGTRPWLMVAGLFLGLLLAGFGVYRMIRPFMNHKDNKENRS